MITVKTHKNTLFFFFLFNIISKTKDTYHPLGESLIKKFSDLPKEVEILQEEYLEGDIPTHPYQYCTLGINTGEDLKPKKLDPNYEYGHKTLSVYFEKMYPLVLKIEKELNFFNTFTREFLPEYNELCKECQKHIGNDVYDALKEFWDLDEHTELFLIPNVLGTGGSYGLFRKNKMYSITSPVLTKTREFTPAHLRSNSIHEFSHSIFKKKLIGLGEFENFKKIAQKTEISKNMLERHKSPEIYLEEAFVKAVTHFLLTNIYRPFMPKEELEKKEKSILNNIVQDGYIHSKKFYGELKKGRGVEVLLGRNF